MQIVTDHHWTEPVDPNRRFRGKTEGAEGACKFSGRIEVSTNWTPSELPGTKPPMKKLYIGFFILMLHRYQRTVFYGISRR